MRVYKSNTSGCLVLVIIISILIMTIGFFGRILFTTPLGIALIIAFGVKYILDQRKKSSINSNASKFTQGEKYHEYSSEFNDDSEDSFDRSDYLDVEEVKEYKNIDD